MSEEDKAKKLENLLKLLQLNNGDTSKFTQEQKKAMKDHKFWRTQPVKDFDEKVVEEGPIDKPKTPEDISDKPLPLLSSFEWCSIDVDNKKQLEDVFVLLNENYVEDHDAGFRFNYTKEFFNWALKSPGWKKDWHIGVRVKETQKLVAFISAIPVTLGVRGKQVPSVEINFLCVHKQLRSKRLTPVLIKEITRRVNKCDIWHALYTAGIVLPAPVSTCRYTHRPLNWKKLYEVDFTGLPDGHTEEDMIAENALPAKTKTAGLRKLKKEDIDQVFELFKRYQSRFELIQIFTKEEFEHNFIGEESLPLDKQVIFSYVVEQPDGKITDFFSFYSLPFTILNNTKYKDLGIGYLYYYATDADFQFKDRFDPKATKALKTRLCELIYDACILAKNANMDVFNALTSQDNTLFLDDLKFGPGDGFLNFYLFNYRAKPITGGLNPDNSNDIKRRSNVGVVML
ncbi:AAC_HP2_G0036630.mRNA.1.CDS.1 [Saccharomyces cerevisiae]|nr:Nmt1p [Saccharomyces cerevisiae FostersB]CAI4932703.1 CFC_HP_G0051590.mRNA.1.CDS.1 [Saccharomyces cerevisiae]CAI4967816.1 ATV_HP_G0115330.mRNA.1.CDS.1 [Saccharomyces cerevisiae]CAI4987772.1 CFC_HP_G0091030.mRNA.1.CDS.1 [Saccharomyces cerevisiae]CAI5010989.1 CFC_HP_G0010430.mRNA.1.CDS.1 [Saccharomyces cerevisiae]